MTASISAGLTALGYLVKPTAPVSGFTQLLDAGQNVVYTSTPVGQNDVTDWTPSAGTQTSKYSQSLTGKHPFAEVGPFAWSGALFGCMPSVRGDGSSDFLLSINGNFAATMSGLHTPFVEYKWVQFLDATDECLQCFSNSGLTTNFMEWLAATTGNKIAAFVEAAPSTDNKLVNGSTNDQLPHLWRTVFDGTHLTFERDGVDVTVGSPALFQTTAGPVFNQDALFGLVRNGALSIPGHVRLARRLFYSGKSSETSNEKTQNYRYMNQKAVVPANSSLLVTVGDSTSLVEHPWSLQLNIGGLWVYNPAISSQPMTSALGLIKDQCNSVLGAANFARSAASCYIGAQDLVNGRTSSQLITDLQTWSASSKAANPTRKLICRTIPAANTISGGAETQRLAYNTSVRASTPTNFDAMTDDDTALGGLAFPTGPYTIDGVHCNDAGNAIVAGLVQTVLQGWGF